MKFTFEDLIKVSVALGARSRELRDQNLDASIKYDDLMKELDWFMEHNRGQEFMLRVDKDD